MRWAVSSNDVIHNWGVPKSRRMGLCLLPPVGDVERSQAFFVLAGIAAVSEFFMYRFLHYGCFLSVFGYVGFWTAVFYWCLFV